MNENENLVIEQITENVEPTTEEMGEQVVETPVKTYTQEELDEIIGKRLARNSAKIRKEYEREKQKYAELENILKAGTGKEDVTEVAESLRGFYESKGIQIPTQPSYSERDIEVLARAEAEDIINAGLDEVTDEVNRLADIGLENMTAREKKVFQTLAEHRKTAEQSRELAKIGVTEDVIKSKEFKDFASKFNSNTSVVEIYELYNKMQPKKDIKPMGSLRTNTPPDTGVKEFYTRDEALQFTKADFDKNPALFKAVEQSMMKW